MKQNYFLLFLAIFITNFSNGQAAAALDYHWQLSANANDIVIANVLANDYINNVPANLSNVILTQTTSSDLIELQPDGSVKLLHDADLYDGGSFNYEICDIANPNNCSTGYVYIRIGDNSGVPAPTVTIVSPPSCGNPFATLLLSNITTTPLSPGWIVNMYSDNTVFPEAYSQGEAVTVTNVPVGLFSFVLEDILDGFHMATGQFYVPEPVCDFNLTFNGTVTDANSNGITDVGDTIDYVFTVTNNGNVPLTNITVSCPTLNVLGGPIANLPAGSIDNTTFTAAYPLTQELINSNIIEHLGTVTAMDGSNTVSDVYMAHTVLNTPDGIRFEAFVDTNGNGIKDLGELPLQSNGGTFNYEINNDGQLHHVSTLNTSFILYETNPLTSYQLSLSAGYYSSSYILQSGTTYNNVTVANGSGITTYLFPVTIIPRTDFDVHIRPNGRIRPGGQIQHIIQLSNYGTAAIASGTVTYTPDSRLTINSVSTAVSNTPTGFTYSFSNFAPSEVRTIDVLLTVLPVPQVNSGDLLTSTISATINSSTEIHTSNNQAVLAQLVTNSWDPNDISETHGPEILHSAFSPDDFLTYTIRFENTGNADAINIKITDLLDEQLDETTIRMVDASHNYVMERVGRNLRWHFDGIDLEPSVADTDIGKGFIMFDIKPKPGYAVGDVIANQANIYFDFNPAVATNMFETEFVSVLSANEFESGIVSVYPNPTDHLVNIKSRQHIDTAEVYDMLGKQLMRQMVNGTDTQLNLSALGKGLYLVKLLGDSETTVKVVRK